MAFSDLFGAVVGKVSGALGHEEAATILLKDFSLDVIRHLGDGRLPVTEDVVRSQVACINEPGVTLKELRCRPDGVFSVVEVKKLGANLEAHMCLQLRRLALTESTQTLVLHVTDEKSPVGKNLLGKMAASIGTAFLGSLTNFALKNSDLGPYTSYDDSQKLITVSLGKIPDLQPLLNPINPSWENSVPVRWVGIEGATHIEGGVALHLFVSQAAKDVSARF